MLLRDGQPIPVPPKDIDTLILLVKNSGHIVDKEEFFAKVWAGLSVEEGNLARRISNLRNLLAEGSDGQIFIETIPRRGYRFTAEVKERPAPTRAQGSDAGAELVAPEPNPAKSRRTGWAMSIGIATMVLVGVLVWQHRSSVSPAATGRIMLAVLAGPESQRRC